MKRHLIVAGAMALCIGFSAFSTAPKSVSLIEALALPGVQTQLISKGISSQECVEFEVVNNSGQPLAIQVEPGTRLTTGQDGYQDILVTQPAEFIVEKGGTSNKLLTGYCCQSSEGVPNQGDLFASAEMADDELVKLAQHIGRSGYGPSQTQAAVWSISDKHSLAGIYATDDDHALREFCADIRGEETPWYNLDYGEILDRPFENVAQTLSGEMEYEIDHLAHADLKVFNPEGELMVTFYEDKLLTPASYTQRFSFSAYNLDEGEYTFALFLDGEIAHKRIVEI